MLVGVKRGDRFAECFAHAIARIWPHRSIGPDAARPRIETDSVSGGREHDALDAVAPRGLEQIVGPDDVAVEDRVPGTFDRKAAEMDDALHTGDRALHLGDRGEI